PYLRRHSQPQLSITRSWPVITRRRLEITEDLQRGGGLLCLLTVLLPVSSATLLWMAVHSPPVKHSQHTVNPLISPHVNPFLPSAISTVSVLFFTLITVLVSLGMSWCH
ncbi:unnamed protein product, partial [Staurois parvus]